MRTRKALDNNTIALLNVNVRSREGMKEWGRHKSKSHVKREVGEEIRKRKGERPTLLPPVSSRFFQVCAFSILRTRLSQSLEQARGIGTKRWPIQECVLSCRFEVVGSW